MQLVLAIVAVLKKLSTPPQAINYPIQTIT